MNGCIYLRLVRLLVVIQSKIERTDGNRHVDVMIINTQGRNLFEFRYMYISQISRACARAIMIICN